jgi:hypothetical protein
MNDAATLPAKPESAGPTSAAVHCTPLPAWVLHDPWPTEQTAAAERCTDNGLLRLLHDTQISLLEAGVAYHTRVVQRVLTRAGAERASHFAVEFDPAYDQVEVHSVRVWRNGTSIEHANNADFQLLRRETQLERLALNGRLTATLLIRDLRVDDQLEVAFTLRTYHAVLSGGYFGWTVFDRFAPWMETRHRRLRPIARAVHLKEFNAPPKPDTQLNNGIEDSRYRSPCTERQVVEDLPPPWKIRAPCFQATEFDRWAQVAQLFESYYRDSELPDEVTAALARLQSEHPDPEDLAAEWLRFVQHELRYFALSLGETGLIPRTVDVIWSRRFGDCKDAARLYVAGARRLGLDASAALVSTTHGPSLDTFLPSPAVFNHVIVRLRLQGKTYWLDPTMRHQAGTLRAIIPLHAGAALPLTPESDGLEQLPTARPEQHIRCDDVLEFGVRADSPATLRRRVEFKCWTADSIRNRIADEGSSKLAMQLLQQLQSSFPKVVESKPLCLEDDLAANRLISVATYEIRDCWKSERLGRLGFTITDPVTAKELAALKIKQRQCDIFLGRPRITNWTLRLRMPCRWRGNGWDELTGEGALQFKSTLAIGERDLDLQRVLTIGAWTLPADQSELYERVTAKSGQNIVKFWARSQFGRLRPPAGPAARWFASRWGRVALWLAILLVLYAIGYLKDH